MMRTFLPTAAALLLQGCMLATQQDTLKLGADVNKVREQQVDLVTKMSELSANLQSLNSQLETSQERMTMLSQKMDDLQADIARRRNVLSGQVTGTSTPSASTPSDVHRLAYNDYQAGKFDLAIVGFRNFMSQFPKSELAPQVQYYIGECEYARKDYADAAKEYDRTVHMFPRSDYAPKALFKRGVALQQLNRGEDAVKAFRRLIKDYPQHELARSARDILKSSE
jgi:tol-pal system protein YbgF